MLERLSAANRGKYEFVREIGRGGMGMVYMARDLELDRLVAVKVLSPHLLTDDKMVERFDQEARTIASLRHQAIVRVYGVGRAEDLHYFVMDYVEGSSLGQILGRQVSLSIGTVRAILYQVGSALSYAHAPERAVIHRDIKPSNILLDADGNVVVMDFGISKVLGRPSGLTVTQTVMGTPEYMSPEQCRGHKVAQASDQYSLGAVAFGMLTGAPPFTGPFMEVLLAHQLNEPPDVRSLRPDCPAELATGIARMLAKAPADRWPDIEDAMAEMGLQPMLRKDPARAELVALVRDTMEVHGAKEGASSPSPASSANEASESPTGIRILEIPSEIETGEHLRLHASMLFAGGEEGPGKGVSWESTDPSIVRIDRDSGELVAVGSGSTRITAVVGGVSSSTVIEVLPTQVPAEVETSSDKPALDTLAAKWRWLGEVRPRDIKIASTVVGALALVIALWQFWPSQPTARAVSPGPRIEDLQSSATSITLGDEVTLTWRTSLADSVHLLPGEGSVAVSGSAALSPEEDTEYVLRAFGPGGSIRQSIRIGVTAVAPVRPQPRPEVTRPIDPSITIAPTTIDDDPVADLSPPPSDGPARDVSAAPAFTPMTVRPEITNRGEIEAALTREYPSILRDNGVGGRVIVWFFVSEEGRVLDTRIAESSGRSEFDEAALRVADGFRFSPALNREQIVQVWIQLPIVFRVR